MAPAQRNYVADSEDEDSLELRMPDRIDTDGRRDVPDNLSYVPPSTTMDDVGFDISTSVYSAIIPPTTGLQHVHPTTAASVASKDDTSPALNSRPSSSRPRPRPRPRPVGKARSARSNTNQLPISSMDYSLRDLGTGSSSSFKRHDETTEADALDDFSLGAAERAKLRSRAMNMGRATPSHMSGPIIDISSEDEIAPDFAKPAKKDPPKSRRVKRLKTAHSLPADTSVSSENSIPVPSSSFPIPVSDPLPRIHRSTPPPSSVVLSSSPLSSPGNNSRALTRPNPPPNVSSTNSLENTSADLDARLMPPPPPLFFDDQQSTPDVQSEPPPPPPSKKRKAAARKGKQAAKPGDPPAKPTRKSKKRTTVVEVVITTPPSKRRAAGDEGAVSDDDMLPVAATAHIDTLQRRSPPAASPPPQSITPASPSPRSVTPALSTATHPVRQPSIPVPGNNDFRYTISRSKSLPMSELIRRAASRPESPVVATPSRSTPLAKTGKSALRNIAPLLHIRRTPPPPRPPLPPPKKTKKQLELEEKWMEELEDEVPDWFDLDEKVKNRHLKRKRDEYYYVDD